MKIPIPEMMTRKMNQETKVGKGIIQSCMIFRQLKTGSISKKTPKVMSLHYTFPIPPPFFFILELSKDHLDDCKYCPCLEII